MKYIDPDKPNPFDPSNFYQEDIQFIENKKPSKYIGAITINPGLD